jgi:hypothetical protein
VFYCCLSSNLSLKTNCPITLNNKPKTQAPQTTGVNCFDKTSQPETLKTENFCIDPFGDITTLQYIWHGLVIFNTKREDKHGGADTFISLEFVTIIIN